MNRLAAAALACVAVGLAQPTVLRRLTAGYEGDDFWTLADVASPAASVAAGAIAAALSLAGLAGAVALSVRIARVSAPWPARAALDAGAKTAGAIALFAAAPQAFYELYRLSIPGLPAQWVLAAPASDRLAAMLAFPEGGRMADHMSGALFWGAILSALWAQAPEARIAGAFYKAACFVAAVGAPAALRAGW